ncbi:hypothetical protein CY0110_19087 [Crocosphaera chwakensis CCY0110]|uniref:Uncharacterized protein n=1 Tax=Crocosphaera chwakensis CCY0110 TaxID=391612 RepID=A3IJE9_9CHRO|nr:hypothetical protein CY0110_19087 [Crocosphaera chwakensis CCY0110]
MLKHPNNNSLGEWLKHNKVQLNLIVDDVFV